jgi:5-methylcytosine-specific restriction endonuclease McrA
VSSNLTLSATLRSNSCSGYTDLVPYKDPAQKREWDRQWVAARRAAWFADKCCVRCSSVDKLRLDHIDAKTKVRRGDHAIWSWTLERREAELAKCQVLCEGCHKTKTRECMEKARGERVGAARLTEADVRAIRVAVAAGATKRGTARRYGVNDRTVRDLCAGRTWLHIKDTEGQADVADGTRLENGRA